MIAPVLKYGFSGENSLELSFRRKIRPVGLRA
jgi:hypothetical protein